MAAPDGISWSSVQNSFHRLGIYVSLTNTDTKTTVSIQTWLWTKWSLSDSLNEYYFNNNATTAKTLVSKNLKLSHTVSSGSGWSTSNQTKLGTHSYTYDRGTTAKAVSCAAKITPIGSNESTVTHKTSYTIPALASYSITYNANGGSDAPSTQTKWHGIDITLSTVIPTRTGYSFLGWGTYSSATSSSYLSGASYTSNASVTLYAVWKANTYLVSYNANGGTNPPANQTKTYDQSLTLASSIPTRENYNFLGWGLSASSTTVAYSAGGTYTANAPITLYAIWELGYSKPAITITDFNRCGSSGVASDTGTYFSMTVSWTVSASVKTLLIEWKAVGTTTWTSNSTTLTTGTADGSVYKICGNGAVLEDSTYDVRVTITDEVSSSTIYRTLPGIAYSIDFKYGGKGAAFGKPAETENLLDINWNTKVRGQIEAENATIEGSVVGSSAEFSRMDITDSMTATSATVSTLYDKYGTQLTNGLTLYTSAGIDPDTTLDHLILTNNNTPNGGFMYIKTEFYSTKSATANRMQTAFPYNSAGSPYYRYYSGGTWSDWTKIVIPTTLSKPEKVIWKEDAATTTTTSTATALYTWTADENGLYGIAGSFSWIGNKTGVRAAYVRIPNWTSSTYRDVAYVRQYAYGASNLYQNVFGYVRLTAGHNVVLYAWQDSGGDLKAQYKQFQIVKIGL